MRNLQPRDLRQGFLPLLIEVAIAGMMLAALVQAQVFGSIVRAEAVSMVDGFVPFKSPTELVHHDHDVLVDEVFVLTNAPRVRDGQVIRFQKVLGHRPATDKNIATRIEMPPCGQSVRCRSNTARTTHAGENASAKLRLNDARNLPPFKAARHTDRKYVNHALPAAARHQQLSLRVVDTWSWLVLPFSRTVKAAMLHAAPGEFTSPDSERHIWRAQAAPIGASRLWARNEHFDLIRASCRPLNLRVRRPWVASFVFHTSIL